MYKPPHTWSGRVDGTTDDYLRWHQVVKLLSLNDIDKNPFADSGWGMLGFCCDEGVRRNMGRVGAKDAPDVIRKFCSNLPVHEPLKLIDAGNIICDDLERCQASLANAVATIHSKGLKTIVLGGGHEVVYGHYNGLKKVYPAQKIGIINIDAHFDNRTPNPTIGATSGTGFWQIAQESNPFLYLAIGIQTHANTKALFNTATESGTQFILADDFKIENKQQILQQIDEFIAQTDILYLTVCLDVFSAAFAPGVSAPAAIGIQPDHFFMEVFRYILTFTKLKAFDIAELNPIYDIDNRTARLVAALLYEVLN